VKQFAGILLKCIFAEELNKCIIEDWCKSPHGIAVAKLLPVDRKPRPRVILAFWDKISYA